jgi:hypothetical protein
VFLEPDFTSTPPSRNQALGEQFAASFLEQSGKDETPE